ncbi:1,3-beta-glucanosyltransferase gas1, partial [Mycoblastus sanguinarius]|nr:1,3-beta-glucanosyltransferase gas1 [Mycoblastus sanguinarius]
MLQALGTTVVRSFAINPTQDHSQCMETFASAGIYVLIDLTAPGFTFEGTKPLQWNTTLYTHFTSVIDTMQPFWNTLGFFVADELSTVVRSNSSSSKSTNASSYVRAAVRDMKAYMVQKNYRNIPIGYATSESSEDGDMYQLLKCGDQHSDIDFLGINTVGLCEASSFDTSDYGMLVPKYLNYTIPTLLAEYGCAHGTKPQISNEAAIYENFTEIAAIYGNLTSVISGGLYYTYFGIANATLEASYGTLSVIMVESPTNSLLGLVAVDPNNDKNFTVLPAYTITFADSYHAVL